MHQHNMLTFNRMISLQYFDVDKDNVFILII